MDIDSWALYRSIIDELVRECLHGQGTVRPSWIRRGDWPLEADINALLEKLSPEERGLIARMLGNSVNGGQRPTRWSLVGTRPTIRTSPGDDGGTLLVGPVADDNLEWLGETP